MIEITQVNASLDEAGDENACLIVGKRVAKRVLRCKDSEIKSIELHRKSIDARKKRDVHFILSFRVELTSPHLEREAVDSVACAIKVPAQMKFSSSSSLSFVATHPNRILCPFSSKVRPA